MWIVEVWDRRGMTRVDRVLTARQIQRQRVLRGADTLTFTASGNDRAADLLVRDAVIRLQVEGSATELHSYRVAKRSLARAEDGSLTVSVAADALWTDLRRGVVQQALAAGKRTTRFGLVGQLPSSLLATILAGYEGDGAVFALGVVEPTALIDMTFDDTSPAQAAGALENAVQEAAGVGELEYVLAADGRTYTVNLRNRIGTDRGAALRYGHNLRGLTRSEDGSELATRLRARGSGLLTLADARWTVASYAAGKIAFNGASPVWENGVFYDTTGARVHYFYISGKGAYPIASSSTVADGRLAITLGALPSPASGDVGWIARDVSGSPVDYLDSAAGTATYGVVPGVATFEDVPDADNPIPNSDLGLSSGGIPVGWSMLGGVVPTEVTDRAYARTGGSAWRVSGSGEGKGFRSPVFAYAPTTERPHVGMMANLHVAAGQVLLLLRHSNGVSYPVTERPGSSGTGIYITLSCAPVHDQVLPAGTAQLDVISLGAAAFDFTLDCVMAAPVVGEELPGYVAGSGAHLLWTKTAAELRRRASPRLEYQVSVPDLYEVDRTRFAFSRLDLGDDVRIRDPRYPAETLRVVELTERVNEPEQMQVTVAAGADGRLYDPYAPDIGGSGRPAASPYGTGPAPRGARVAVKPRFLSPPPSSTVDTLRLDVDDPESAAAAARFYYTDGAGVRTGPLAATRTPSAGAYEYDVVLHQEHNVYVEWEVPLKDGRVISGGPVPCDHDSTPSKAGEPTVSYNGRDALVVIPWDSDTTAVYVQKSLGSGVWGAAVLATGAPVATYTAQRSGSARDWYRTYGVNAAGVAATTYSQFYVDRWDGARSTVVPTARFVAPPPSATLETLRLDVADPESRVTAVRFFYTDASGVRSGPLSATRTPSSGVYEYDAARHPEHNTYVEWEILVADGQPSITSGPLTLDSDDNANPSGEPSVYTDGIYAEARIPFDSDSVEIAIDEETGVGVWTPRGSAAGTAPGVYTGTRSSSATTRYRATGRNAAGTWNTARPVYFYFERWVDPQSSRQPPEHRHQQLAETSANETWEFDGALGEGGTAPVQARILTAAGAVVVGWTAVPFTHVFGRVPAQTQRFGVELRDSTAGTPLEAARYPLVITAKVSSGQYDGDGAVISVRDPGGGGYVDGGQIMTARQRVLALSDADGYLKAGVRGRGNFGVGDFDVFSTARHVELLYAKDGDVVAFARQYEHVPRVFAFLRKGSALTSRWEVAAVDVTRSTVRARAVLLGTQTSSPQTDYFASALNGTENPGGILLSADGDAAYSNLQAANGVATDFVVELEIDASGMDLDNTVDVIVSRNDGPSSVAWTPLAQIQRWSDPLVLAESIPFSGTLSANWDLCVHLDYKNPPGANVAYVTVLQVDYTVITPGTESSLAASAGDMILLYAVEAP